MAGGKQRVSLCMIVRDEEQNLEACLAPVADLFDEIIIVDTGSRDGTLEIARRFTSQVYQFQWCDDFAAARNESLRHATGDWVFWLDADDRIQPSQVAPLRELLANLDDQPRVFMLNTIVLPSHAHAEPRIISHQRLFRRHPDLQWRGRVHEQLTPVFEDLGYQRCFPNIEIVHVGYQDRALADRKARRKLRLLRMDFAEDPTNACTLFHLSMALHQAGNYPDAIRHLLHLLNSNDTPPYFTRWIYDALVELSNLSGNAAEAVRFADRGLAAFPEDEYLLYARAKISYVCKDFRAAVSLLERALRAPQREMLFQVPGNLKSKLVPLMLGASHRMLRHYAQAEGALQAVLGAHPHDNDALFNLGLVYLDQGRGTDLMGIAQQLLAATDGTSNAKLLGSMWNLRYGHLRQAGQLIDELIFSDPYLIRARILRVELLSRSQAPLEDQIRAINDVLRLDPASLDARNWLQEIRQLQASRAPAVIQYPSSSPSLATSS